MFSDASSFDSRPDERLAGCWLSLNITDDWIALHFVVALATHRTGSIWWMRAQTCFHRHPVKTFLELSATICSQSRVANQQIINNGSCAECWPRLFETSARSRKMVMAWRYTHTRVEPHSNMTRLEQCDGVSYGHDRTTLTPSAYIGSVCETETMSQGFCFFSSCWRAFRPNRTIMLAKLRVCSSTIIRIVCYARQQRGGAGSISAWPPFEIPSYFWKRATNN